MYNGWGIRMLPGLFNFIFKFTQSTVGLFWCILQWVLTNAESCNHHHKWDTDQFFPLKKFPVLLHCSHNLLHRYPLTIADVFSIPTVLPFPGCHADEIMQDSAFWVSAMLSHRTVVHSFWWLSSIPLHRRTAVCLSIHQVRDIWVLYSLASRNKPAKLIYLWALWEYKFSFLLSKCLQVGFLGSVVSDCL